MKLLSVYPNFILLLSLTFLLLRPHPLLLFVNFYFHRIMPTHLIRDSCLIFIKNFFFCLLDFLHCLFSTLCRCQSRCWWVSGTHDSLTQIGAQQIFVNTTPEKWIFKWKTNFHANRLDPSQGLLSSSYCSCWSGSYFCMSHVFSWIGEGSKCDYDTHHHFAHHLSYSHTHTIQKFQNLI